MKIFRLWKLPFLFYLYNVQLYICDLFNVIKWLVLDMCRSIEEILLFSYKMAIIFILSRFCPICGDMIFRKFVIPYSRVTHSIQKYMIVT